MEIFGFEEKYLKIEDVGELVKEKINLRRKRKLKT